MAVWPFGIHTSVHPSVFSVTVLLPSQGLRSAFFCGKNKSNRRRAMGPMGGPWGPPWIYGISGCRGPNRGPFLI